VSVPVQRLAGLRWNARAGRYVLPSGRFLSRTAVLETLERQIEATTAAMRADAESLQAGRVNLAEWQLGMERRVKSVHLLATAIEHGGFDQLSRADLGWIGSRVRAQYGYLANFAREIERGAQRLDGRFLARVALYAEAARSTQREAARRRGVLAGHDEERNVLSPADHCHATKDVPGCEDETARGWVRIGTLAAIGSRRCRSRCRCVIVTRAAGAA
jgi:hypothetical protein